MSESNVVSIVSDVRASATPVSEPCEEPDVSSLQPQHHAPTVQQNATFCNTTENTTESPSPNSSPGEDLSTAQSRAIELLLQGFSDVDVARQVGVDRTTIFRWRRKQAFRKDLARQRKLLLRQSIKRLQSLLEPAIDILHRQISGTDDKTALRAASILLRFATPGRLERMAEKS